MEGGFWQEQYTKYVKALPMDRTKKESFYALELELANAVAGAPKSDDAPDGGNVDAEQASAVLEKAVACLPALRESLRDGACEKIEGYMFTLFEREWGALCESKEPDASKLITALGKKVDVLKSPGELRNVINNKLSLLADASNVDKLAAAFLLSFSGYEDAVTFKSCLEPFIGQSLEDEQLGLIADTRELLWKLLSTLCESASATSEQCDSVVAALDVIKKFSKVRKIDGDDNRQFQDLPATVARGIFSLRGAIANLRSAVQYQAPEDDAVDKLLSCVEDYKKRIIGKHSDGGDLPGVLGTWVKAMLVSGSAIYEEARTVLAARVVAQLESKKSGMIEAEAALRPIARGHPAGEGKSWHVDLKAKPTIDEVIAEARITINVAKGGSIAAGLSKLDQVFECPVGFGYSSRTAKVINTSVLMIACVCDG
jgi:hypothetical protein